MSCHLRHLVDFSPRLLAVATIAALGASHGGDAQAQKVRPGLWENTVSIKSGGGQAEAAMAQMRAQLASMPPEQRAQVEAMMARQGMGMAPGKPNAVRSCITPEMASRSELHPGDKNCKSTGHSRSGNTVRFKFACENERGTAEGEGEFVLVSDTETKGKMFVNATRQGQAFRMDMVSSSKWIAADCGDVKPPAVRK
ncbi:MAG: DUF3617 domain-containing protein [Burkholderiales bacterium]|nr:DUF3617 domain-containing protein [Burkholderiales bacterium]